MGFDFSLLDSPIKIVCFRGTDPNAANAAAQLQQTLITLTHSPYGDSPLFWNMKDSSTKREEILKPTNPAAQKALLANQHKVSPVPISKIKPKALSNVLNGNKVRFCPVLKKKEMKCAEIYYFQCCFIANGHSI